MADNILEGVRGIVFAEGLKKNRINEALLVEKLGVSRTSVREVLKHLEKEDLIERRQGFGISLKTPNLRELIEIYDIRILLEGLAVRYLTENLSSAVLDNLKKASENFNRIKKGKDNKKLIMADAEFHRIIIESCLNKHLPRIINNLHLITLSFRVVNNIPPSIPDQEVVYPHEKVLAALETGNAKKTEEILRLHIEEGKNNLVKFMLGPGIKLYRQKSV